MTTAERSANTTHRTPRRWKAIGFILPILISVLLTWLGVNDFRLFQHTPPPSISSTSTHLIGGATAPVEVTILEGNSIDISWTVVEDPDVYSYDVTVVAVHPLRYTYSIPRYSGDRDVNERHYPVDYLSQILEDEGRAERIEDGQVWHICVQAMKKQPLNTPIDEYIIPGTKACSNDFTMP
ncbi:hypothetical protein [Actinomyces sp. 432]|uniref:hypothetical protein n=1 Tax=Actinomyces sp. 432 TaxID=2057798 RepID=UPI00137B8EE4|nr:hypothetical protein [Actinomyces sp. 432]